MDRAYASRRSSGNRPPPSIHSRRAALRFRRRLVLEALELGGCHFAGRVRAPDRVLSHELERLDDELVGAR